MASSILSSPLFLVHQHPNPIKKTLSLRRVLVFAKQDSQDPSSSLIRVGSSIKIQKVCFYSFTLLVFLHVLQIIQTRSCVLEKVFEDKSRGIVCYLDDQGEMTCEGYDEGPRFHEDVSRFSCNQREKQDFVHILERGLLQVTDGGKVN
ncbi:hypothetical protein SSX86_021244 [Deinandra increscens subsp. villosa]|uniref:Uncharacterized protein n=1 Tax=Deinandra increscens subsp. villosa TaxID=3103831 RepID=A0AAP0GVM4_9ASTR